MEEEYDLDNFVQYLDENHPELLEKILVRMYESDKYNHRDIAYLFDRIRYENNIYARYVEKAAKEIITIMINKKIDPKIIYEFVLRYNVFARNTTNTQCHSIDIIDIFTAEINNSTYFIRVYNMFLSTPNGADILCWMLDETNRYDRIDKILNYFKEKSYNGNDILTEYLNQRYTFCGNINIAVPRHIVEVLGVDFDTLKSNDIRVNNYIEELRKEGV